jgi:hypothetical protein
MAIAKNAAAAALPPALRERAIVIDDFLPVEQAEAMRRDIDAHFAGPATGAPDARQVWDYWFAPELHTYLRTQPDKVIAQPAVEAFTERLRVWSTQTLGLARLTWPYLSLYVPGCRQALHNETGAGRFGYVYSLTRDERRTQGGETIVHKEGDVPRTLGAEPAAGRSLFDAIAPRFNRLVVFDDRMPQAVERVEGSMDPREGRFVLHGHLSESEPMSSGALSGEVLARGLRAVINTFVASTFLDDYHGPLTLRIEVGANGKVSSCQVLLDRVLHPSDDGTMRWPRLLNDLVSRLNSLAYPPAAGPSQMLIPICFGAPLRQAGAGE